jgi:hypothetical protein
LKNSVLSELVGFAHEYGTLFQVLTLHLIAFLNGIHHRCEHRVVWQLLSSLASKERDIVLRAATNDQDAGLTHLHTVLPR